MNSKVYLVGAGPGDAGLLTVKAQSLIRLASVVIYDALVSRPIVGQLPTSAKLIYVGKRAGRHALKQEEINALLVAEAQATDGVVVRLKGGDPFVFGRGGEEVEALRLAGIPYEVVPGISAGIAAPAYFGVPVTHRGISRAVSLITASSLGDGDVPDLQWEVLARMDGTLVFYMGMRWVSYIAQKLMESGMSAEHSAGIVSQGTLPEQKLLKGTLAGFATGGESYEAYSPGLFVVGEVLGLADANQWYMPQPLSGQRILVTRSEAQASDLVTLLEGLGAEAVLLPTIQIVGRDVREELKTVIFRITSGWLVFTSPNAVQHFVAQLLDCDLDIRTLANYRVACIGPATKKALLSYGIRADFMPSAYDSDSFVRDFLLRDGAAAEPIILPTSSLSSGVIERGLEAKGYSVHAFSIYDNEPLCYSEDDILRLRLDEVDWLTFCSSSAVHNFMTLASTQLSLASLLDRVKVASIGVNTTQTLREYGITHIIQPEKATLPLLAECIVQAVESER